MFACGRARSPFSVGNWRKRGTPKKKGRKSQSDENLESDFVWQIYLAAICMCIYCYYSFISKAHPRSFTIYLPLGISNRGLGNLWLRAFKGTNSHDFETVT